MRERRPPTLLRHALACALLALLLTVGASADGDFEMLEWTTAGPGPRLSLLVHHDDGEREVAYDRQSTVGRLDRGLDEAPKRGWTLVSMKRDWKQVFPSD